MFLIVAGQNSLQGIHFELSCLPHLRFLDLERNKIRSLNDEDMATLDWFPEHNRSLTIDISDNPLMCDCRRFYSWLQNTKVVKIGFKFVCVCSH